MSGHSLLIKKSGTASSTPTAGELDSGEIAINYADGAIYHKNGAGTVVELVNGCQPLSGPRMAAASTTARLDLEAGDPTTWTDVVSFNMYRTSGTKLYFQVTWLIEQTLNISGAYHGARIVRDDVTTLTGIAASSYVMNGSLTWAAGLVPINALKPVGSDDSMTYSTPHIDDSTSVSGDTNYKIQIISDHTNTGNQYVEASCFAVEV